MKSILAGVTIVVFTYYLFAANSLKNISEENLIKIEKKYGKKAKRRVELWDKMLEGAKDKKALEKLKAVNDFFNKIKYGTDKRVWKKRDYWAAPFEFMGVGAGDCEDYAIAKYFALRALGIHEEKLKITYVKLKQKRKKYEEAHMVLNYYHKPNSTPIVLDNVNKKLKLATKRTDLKPVYSFNASGLWAAQNKTKSLKSQGENKLKKWQAMMSRI
ncbi:MAG: transglutaminase-like cysteine peptidase [Campylobacterota bacterium]|nr:transglutaminase-like cysteine peptidase [Campylobacterota bacterium]